ncbi:unnamed protein product, partial [Schistosoma curassoni]|uniref:USP domain-containing protein n=1 Tax=Schistosoma curassoni TaxID=6186 RepID=A0A183JVM6_9TREM
RNINSNYTSENITEAILTWDDETTQILEDCENIGSEKCLTVRYECLVLNPLREIQKVLHFSIHESIKATSILKTWKAGQTFRLGTELFRTAHQRSRTTKCYKCDIRSRARTINI